MKLICIGDSLTFGYGVSSDDRWTSIVSRELSIDVENCGISGDTTGGMLVRLNSILHSYDLSQTIIMITGGGNDIIFGQDLSYPKMNMVSMSHQIIASKAYPLIGIMMPLNPDDCYAKWGHVADFANAGRMILEYRNWLKTYCRNFYFNYLDFGQILNDSCGKSGNILLDGMHPTVSAHKCIAEKVECKISEIARAKKWII